MELLTEINSFVWGKWMIALLLFSGVYLSFKTGFIQISKFSYMLKNTLGSVFKKKDKPSGGITPFQAVSTALAGTIGTGSIAGIATAITLGGPGAVFWMWVSAFFGMATKYSEIVLSVKYREKNKEGRWVSGPMYYIEKGLGKKRIAVLFSVFAICGSFGIGNTVQSNAISQVLLKEAGLSPWITATILCVIATAVVLGGIKTISKVNEKLVPGMALLYIFCSVAVLFVNMEKIPEVFKLIFHEAFNFKAVTGGSFGIAMQYGFSRGIFSNEAGLGSAPIVHGASDAKHPAEQGLWGMFEVFFTTIVICTLTAFVILTSGLWQHSGYDGATLSSESFKNVIGSAGSMGVSISTVLFALSSILGWAYYGEACIEYLSDKSEKAVSFYRVIYVVFVFIGAVSRLDLVWSVSEIMNALMAVPNLIAVIALGEAVKKITGDYFK